VTELVDPETDPERESGEDSDSGSRSDPEPMSRRESESESSPDCKGCETVVARIRDRGERVRRRELETDLRRLEARGEVTAAERRVVADLAADLADSLVERWVAGVTDGDADPDDALALLDE
jgi:hypothetical protein